MLTFRTAQVYEIIAQSYCGLWPAMTTCNLKVLCGLQESSAGCWPSCDGNCWPRTCKCWPGTSLWPVGRREVLCSLLSVGEFCTMVFSSRCKVSMVFSSRWSLIVHEQSGISCWPRSPTSCRPVGDNRYKLELSQRLVGRSETGRQLVAINMRWSATVIP